MKNIFLPFLLIILMSDMVAAQTPAIDLALTIMDNTGGTQVLRFGLDPTATEGIDAPLGESELPPVPPSGVFDARFIGDDISLPQLGQGTARDYRKDDVTFSGVQIHEFRYQPGTGTGITISWNLPASVTGQLQDLPGGGVVNQAIRGAGSYTVANPGVINKLKLIMKYTLTSVKQGREAIPAKFQLNPNFPNPFNPVRTIEFALPVPAEVILKIFNATGLEIQALLNQKLAAGMHRVQWEAQNFPNGVYFFRLQAGTFAQTRRLILLK